MSLQFIVKSRAEKECYQFTSETVTTITIVM